MKTRKILAIFAMAMLCVTGADAQGFLKKLKDKAVDTVKDKVENKVEREAGKAADEVLDGKKSGKKGGGEEETVTADQQPAKSQMKKAQGEEAKSDFVPGSIVIFEDNLQGEQLGEFPSKWDLLENNAEVARMNGKMAIKFEHGSDTEITPLLEDGN